jgi:predicted nucleic acid-binding protein
VKNGRTVLRALELFGSTASLDFGDAMLVAQSQQSRLRTIYSYDTDFDRVAGLRREEP